MAYGQGGKKNCRSCSRGSTDINMVNDSVGGDKGKGKHGACEVVYWTKLCLLSCSGGQL